MLSEAGVATQYVQKSDEENLDDEELTLRCSRHEAASRRILTRSKHRSGTHDTVIWC